MTRMMRTSRAGILSLIAMSAGFASSLSAQTPPVASAVAEVNASERAEVVESLASALTKDFFEPDIGLRYAAMLRANLAAGNYDLLSDPEAFGARVTSDLQGVFADKHLRVGPKASFARPRPALADAPLSTRPSGPPGLEEAKMIGTVAYLRFNLFPDEPESAQRARRFLLDHAKATAVIIDARPCRGGGLSVMNAVLPLLYARRATQLRMDTRASAAESEETDPTLVRRPSPASVVRYDHVISPDRHERRLQHVPVYYLSSRRTASAAEHLALGFKRNRRAVLIGETTAGANHFGLEQALGQRFIAFVPVGRSYDPDTGEDWEGKGIAPDVAVAADLALDEALRRAEAASRVVRSR